MKETLSDLSDGELQDLAALCFDVQRWHQEDMTPERECVWCHASVHTPSHLEPTPTCNLCAQRVAGLLPEMVAELQRHRAAQRADAVRVRNVVRDAVRALLRERRLYVVKPYWPTIGEIALEAYGHGKACDAAALLGEELESWLDAIADRVAAELATAAPASAPVLSAEERIALDMLRRCPCGSHLADAMPVLDRLLGGGR